MSKNLKAMIKLVKIKDIETKWAKSIKIEEEGMLFKKIQIKNNL